MYKHEMTKKQVAEKNRFNQKLKEAGWNGGTWDELLESDAVDVSPEARATLINKRAQLEVEYHAEEKYLALIISEKKSSDAIRFRFYYGKKLDQALDLMVSAQDTLTRKSYLDFLKQMIALCENAAVETDDNLIKLDL